MKLAVFSSFCTYLICIPYGQLCSLISLSLFPVPQQKRPSKANVATTTGRIDVQVIIINVHQTEEKNIRWEMIDEVKDNMQMNNDGRIYLCAEMRYGKLRTLRHENHSKPALWVQHNKTSCMVGITTGVLRRSYTSSSHRQDSSVHITHMPILQKLSTIQVPSYQPHPN